MRCRFTLDGKLVCVTPAGAEVISVQLLEFIVNDDRIKTEHGKMTKTEIAKAFSNGEFEKVYQFISDSAEWIVIEEDRFTGKQAIIENCEQVAKYFKSVTTNFETLNVIADANKIVINGTAEFSRDNKRVSFVSACDVYEFNEKSQIQKITSYCIQSK